MSKTIVIYHRADFDGIFCREIARKAMPHATFIGWDYGDPEPEVAADDVLFMLDISVEGLMGHPNLVWIDHHRSAIDKYDREIQGYRIDGVAACRLAWQFLINTHKGWLPKKKDFIDRNVTEPYAVQLAGEYDIWDKRNPDAELFQHGLRSMDLTPQWPNLLCLSERSTVAEVEALMDAGHQGMLNPDGTMAPAIVFALLQNGRGMQYAKTEENKSIIEAFGFTVEFEGLTFLACNHARYNSHLFSAGLRPEHDGCLGFNWTGKDWRVSLYGVPGKPDVDLAAIAVKHGGGGHKQACGFRADWLPIWAKD